ncbi:hypothetical protein V1288_004403 [Bradyrhizobium sp. AZCC 2176]
MRMVFLALVTSAFVFFTGLSAASAKDYRIQGDDFAGGSGECISRPTRSSSTKAVWGVVRTDIGPRE